MNVVPQAETRVVGDTWRCRVFYVDTRTGLPVGLTALGIVPTGRLLQPATGAALLLTEANGMIEVFDDAGGAVDLVLPPAVTSTFAVGEDATGLPPLVRLQAIGTDSGGEPTTYGLKAIQPFDPLRTDLGIGQPPRALFVAVGPRGPKDMESSMYWREVQNVTVEPVVGVTGLSRASGNAEGVPSPYDTFEATVRSSQPGLLSLVNEDMPELATSQRVAAGAVVRLRMAAFGSAFHSVFLPDAEATVSLVNGYTND